MRLPTLLRKRGTQAQIGGVARLDRRTKNLTNGCALARSRSSITATWIESVPRPWWRLALRRW